MAKRAHHSKENPKANTTRSGSTKDKRPPHAQKQTDKALDPTGALNEHQKLSTNTDRGQTLGNGPWNTQSQMPQGYEPTPFS
jgi:hypothetical protein